MMFYSKTIQGFRIYKLERYALERERRDRINNRMQRWMLWK
jgi:hypothetical protein